jgi:L-iditol 2-dehydrogenase
VRIALTCGTDLKAYVRGHPKIPVPTIFGHEYAGEIAAVGEGVDGWSEGDTVMGVHTGPCGACYWCRRDQEELCATIMDRVVLGTYAEYLELPDFIVRQNLFPKPPDLPFEEAALLEPLACVVRGQRALSLRPDDTVLVIGAGAIGLLHLLALRASGIEAVHVSGRHPGRLALAAELGATVYDADRDDVAEAIRAATGGRGADVVIECTGRLPVWAGGIHLARRGGQVCLFGGPPGGSTITWDTGRLHYDEVRVVSPFHFTPADVRAARDLLIAQSGPESPFRRLITATVPLSEVPAIFEQLRAGHGVKFAIQP